MQEAQYAKGKAQSSLGIASAVLETRDLRKTYGSGEKSLPVLVNANLILQRGEMVAIVGASGVGKSTLLHILGGLDRADRGTVTIGDAELTTMPDAELVALRNHRIGRREIPERSVPLGRRCLSILVVRVRVVDDVLPR